MVNIFVVSCGSINSCCQVPSLNHKRLVMPVDVVRDEYKGYPSKRLRNNVITTVQTSSAFHCTTWCSMTDGCLAVNVIGNHDIACELTTGLSNEDEMQDELSSQLFVASMKKFCQILSNFKRSRSGLICISCISKNVVEQSSHLSFFSFKMSTEILSRMGDKVDMQLIQSSDMRKSYSTWSTYN